MATEERDPRLSTEDDGFPDYDEVDSAFVVEPEDGFDPAVADFDGEH